MVKLIAFVGKMGSGKTTAAKHLVVGHNFYRIRFADGLKNMLIMGLGIDREYIDGEKKNDVCPELIDKTARHGMITLGTEWGRNLIHPDIWVKALAKEFFESIDAGETKFVIDDTRFLNEAKWIHELKTLKMLTIPTIEVKLIRVVRYSDNKIVDHQSETEQDKITDDGVLYNNGSIDSLYSKMDRFFNLTRG